MTEIPCFKIQIELFSIECCKTKTKVNTSTNQNKGEYHKEPVRTQARENASNQVVVGFGFVSDWLRRWYEFFEPITDRVKQNQSNPGFFQHSI